MSLKLDLLSWDNKSANDIKEIYQQNKNSEGNISHLIEVIVEALKDPAQQSSASWMLKHHCENGGKIPAKLVVSIYQNLQLLEDWQTQLHILQTLPYLPITNATKHSVAHYLKQQLTNKNKFIRAWAYNGLHLLAQYFTEYQAEVTQFFKLALKDEAASVKARIRSIQKNQSNK